jgi:hypothetical protein
MQAATFLGYADCVGANDDLKINERRAELINQGKDDEP